MTSVDGGGGKGDNSERSSNQHDTSDQQLPVASCRDSARERRAAKGRRVAPVLHGYTSSYSNMSCCNVVSRKARGRSLALSRRGRYSGCRGRAAPRARTPPRRGARPEVALRLPAQAQASEKRPRKFPAGPPRALPAATRRGVSSLGVLLRARLYSNAGSNHQLSAYMNWCGVADQTYCTNHSPMKSHAACATRRSSVLRGPTDV